MDWIIDYCLQKKGSALDFPFGPETPVLKVSGKMLAFVFRHGSGHTGVNLKCDPVIAANLREQHDCVLPGYHMNKQHWNTVLLDGGLPEEDVFAMIDHSYGQVVNKLPLIQKQALADRL